MTAAVLDDAQDLIDEATSENEAPYGINKKTGKPYRYPPEVRAQNAAKMAAARWGTVPKPPGRTSGTARKTAKGQQDYTAGILGLCQIPAFALGIAARFTHSPALAHDSATISLHAPSIAAALNETAQQQQWLATILERALEVGPYGALLGAFLPLAFQIAANHGKIAANPDMGILDEEGLHAALAELASKR